MKVYSFLVALTFMFNSFTPAVAAQSSCHILDKKLDDTLQNLFDFAQKSPLPKPPLLVPPSDCSKAQFETALKDSYSRRLHDTHFRELAQRYFRNQNNSPRSALQTAEISESGGVH